MIQMASRNIVDSFDDNWSDSGGSYPYSDDGYDETQQSTKQPSLYVPPSTLTGNGALLNDLSYYISTVWREVGRYLRVRECVIENIDIDHEKDSDRAKAHQMLLKWSRRLGSKATLDDLLNVLAYIGKSDIAYTIVNAISVSHRGTHLRQQRLTQRAAKLEEESHVKLQKQVLRQLKKALQFYEERLQEIEDYQRTVFEGREEQEMQRRLQELDKENIQRKLNSLQEQIYKIQERDVDKNLLDKQLKAVADKLYELDKTFKHINDSLAELRVSYYSQTQIECTFIGLCYFRHISNRFPRGNSSSGKHRTSSKDNEELDEEGVFQDSRTRKTRETGFKTSSHSSLTRNTLSRSSLSKLFRRTPPRGKTSPRHTMHAGQEQHARRKLNVSVTDIDELFQLQDFVTKFCRRYRQDRPFIYGHCFMSRGLQALMSQGNDIYPSMSQGNDVYPSMSQGNDIYPSMSQGNDIYPTPCTQARSSIDPTTLPVPNYQSTKKIMSYVTNSSGTTGASTGFVNVITAHFVSSHENCLDDNE